MIGYLAWFTLILGAAGAVLFAAAKLTDDIPESGGLRGFVRDAIAGARTMRVRARKSPSEAGTGGATTGEAATAERTRGPGAGIDRPARTSSLDDFFAAAQQPGTGYVRAEEITAPLERAREVLWSQHLAYRGRSVASAGPETGPARAPRPVPQPNLRPARAGHTPTGSEAAGTDPDKKQVEHNTPAA